MLLRGDMHIQSTASYRREEKGGVNVPLYVNVVRSVENESSYSFFTTNSSLSIIEMRDERELGSSLNCSIDIINLIKIWLC